MKFLLDENLSPRLTSSIPGAQHLRDLLTTGIGGLDIIDFAATHGMTIITADTDFGTLLAASGRAKPSVVLVRELLPLPVTDQGDMIANNLRRVSEALEHGAVIVIGQDRIRVRLLPID